MACCNNERRKDKEYVRNMAIRYSKKMEVDVILHVFSLRGVGKKIYDFTEDKKSVGKHGFVELIKFRGNKSKNILPDTKNTFGNTKGTKTVRKSASTKIKRKSAKVKSKMEISNELAEKKSKGDK